MRPSNHWTDRDDRWSDRGSAPIEFVVAGMLLLVPLLYLMVALGAIQNQALGAQTGARHIARTIATSTDAREAHSRAEDTLAAVVAEYGMDPAAVRLDVRCVPAGVECPSPGATLFVTVASRVALPLVPSVLGWDRLASIPIEAESVQRVSRFWSGS